MGSAVGWLAVPPGELQQSRTVCRRREAEPLFLNDVCRGNLDAHALAVCVGLSAKG